MASRADQDERSTFLGPDMDRQTAFELARALNKAHSDAFAKQPFVDSRNNPVAVFDAVVFPPRRASHLDILTWDSYAAGRNWAIRATRALSATSDIYCGFIMSSSSTLPDPLITQIDRTMKESADSRDWRVAMCDCFNVIVRQRACVYKQDETLALLRRRKFTPSPHFSIFANH